MSSLIVEKNLITQQDIEFGETVVNQTRGGGSFALDKVRNFYPVNSLDELNALDPVKFPKAILFLGNSKFTVYKYVSGTWQAQDPSNNIIIVNNSAAFATLAGELSQVYLLKGTINDGTAGGEFIGVSSVGLTVDNIDIFATATAGVYVIRQDRTMSRKGTFSLVVDTSDAFVRDTMVPIIAAAGARAAIALTLTSINSDYTRMTLAELHEYARTYNTEILSHARNGVILNSSVQTSVGESWIRTSKLDLDKYGFNPKVYVAISSTLDSKFLPEVKKWYNAAYIVSANSATPSIAVNNENSNMYNLNRVALEGAVLANLKACADYAKATRSNICFYTHSSTENLATILAYCNSIGLECELPSEWLARVKGIVHKPTLSHSENLINNSAFLKQKTTDLAPIGWTLTSATMTGITAPVYAGEFGAEIDINATAVAADERLLFQQIYSCGPISEFTPFCFSIQAYSVDATNTIARMRLIAKDAANNVLAQNVKDYTIRGDTQLIYAEQGFISGGTAVSYIQVIVELISIAAGAVRCLLSRPVINRLGFPAQYVKTNLNSSFVKIRKNVQGSAIAPSTDTLVLFDNVLAGANDFYDMATGIFTSLDAGKYVITVTLGLKAMVAGDKMSIKLFVGGVVRESSECVCAAGQMIHNCTFLIPADGNNYKIYIWHNSVAGRLTTTGHDATLSIARVSN